MPPSELDLTRDEQRLILALRDLGPGIVRNAFFSLLNDITAFASEPRCPEMQADGVPCDSAGAQCCRCREAAAVFERLRAEVPH